MGVAPTATAVVPNIHWSEICCQVASSGRKLRAVKLQQASAVWASACLPNGCTPSVAKNYPRGGYRDLLKKLPTSVGSVCRRLLLGEELTGRLRNYQSDWTLAGNESIRSVKSNSILEAQKGSYVLCQYVALSFGKRLPMCVPSTTVFKTHWYFLFKVIKLPKKKTSVKPLPKEPIWNLLQEY